MGKNPKTIDLPYQEPQSTVYPWKLDQHLWRFSFFPGDGSGCQRGDQARVGVAQGEVPQPEVRHAGDVPELPGRRGVGAAQGEPQQGRQLTPVVNGAED